jgi:putative Holliday junction resolvase
MKKLNLNTLLGFDFGTKRIGVAVGQTVTGTARPLAVLNAKQGIPAWENVKALIDTWQPDALIVGIPLNMDGSEQPLTLAARRFAHALEKNFKLPVYGMDERLTSVDARARVFDEGGYKALKNASIDSVAAQLILQNWLAQAHDDEL